MALEVAPSSANDASDTNIVQRMPVGAVNLTKVVSAMGRGPILNDDGELEHKLDEEAQTISRIVADGRKKTTDVRRPY